MSYAAGCDDCEAKTPGHDTLDPKVGFIIHRQVIASRNGWSVEVSASEGTDAEGFAPGFSEHSVILDEPPSELEWESSDDVMALSAALALAAVRLEQVRTAWSRSEFDPLV